MCFSGVPADGVLIVTDTGMVGAFSLPTDPPAAAQQPPGPAGTPGQPTSTAANLQPIVLATASESLGPCRDFGNIVDISYAKEGGYFRVAVVNGNSEHMDSERLKCYRVQLKKRHDQLSIICTAMPSFFLSDSVASDVPDLKVTHLKWMDDSLLVGMRMPGGCILETWSLVEKAMTVHRLLQANSNAPNKTEPYKTEKWSVQGHFKYSSPIVDICTSKFQYGNSSYIFVSLQDNTVQCLHRDTLKRGVSGIVHSNFFINFLISPILHSCQMSR